MFQPLRWLTHRWAWLPMADATKFESERAAWIQGRQWLDKHSATQRAELLARRARKLERTSMGLGDSALHEAKLKSTFLLWTERSEDAKTSALGAIAYVMFVGLKLFWFGIAWVLSWVFYKAWETVADKHRVMVWPYFAAAAAVAVLFMVGRPAGGDLWLINALASWLEVSTGGWIAPRVLSGWYAAGWVSWIEIQIVLGFAAAGWRAYAWGWAAPSVRSGHKTRAGGTADKAIKIISNPDAPKNEDKGSADAGDPGIKIISGLNKASEDEGNKNNV